jgi:hypothetical protein
LSRPRIDQRSIIVKVPRRLWRDLRRQSLYHEQPESDQESHPGQVLKTQFLHLRNPLSQEFRSCRRRKATIGAQYDPGSRLSTSKNRYRRRRRSSVPKRPKILQLLQLLNSCNFCFSATGHFGLGLNDGKLTLGAASAPPELWKYGFGWNPNHPA